MNIVYKHENKAMLHSIKNLLELNGIECFLKNEHSASVAGNLGIGLSEAELWVLHSADMVKAKALIDDVNRNAPTEPEWTCAKCGEKNDGNFQICWKCQAEFAGT
jgi:hypothetical protein